MYLFLRGMNDKGTEQDQTGVYTMNIKQDVIEYLDSALNDKGENSVKSIAANTEAETALTKDKTKAVPQMGFDFD